jgi:nucleoside-diphosphate-sugar epimerase
LVLDVTSTTASREHQHALLTGFTGFIGRNLAERLARNGFAVTALVRPGSDPTKLKTKAERSPVTFFEGDLTDPGSLATRLNEHKWDVIFHVGAVRGGRKVSREEYYRVNVEASAAIGRYARETETKLIFCSSVGVYGAIPRVLPAAVNAPFRDDNFYHFTKIEAEKRLQELIRAGLDCIILRPSITYGTWDYGFPYTLVRLVDQGMLLLPTQPVTVHLVDVDLVCDAFIAAAQRRVAPGSVFNVADLEPVGLERLVDFIHVQLKGTTYPRWKRLPSVAFRLGERVATLIRNELWKARFELVSRSWFYSAESVKTELGVDQPRTMPTFGKVISWYRSLQG